MTGFRRVENSLQPVFRCELDEGLCFYAPGYVCVASAEQAQLFESQLAGEAPQSLPVIRLNSSAQSAVQTYEAQCQAENYKALCLTIYSALECNLGCEYCFAAGSHTKHAECSTDFIMAAGRSLLPNCLAESRPLSIVFHGGGEPGLDPRLFSLLSALKQMAAEAGVASSSYMATNGVMSAETAAQAARAFDAIGLSIDGMPVIQDRQRPLRNAGGSSAYVERSAAIFRAEGLLPSVRMTVTTQSLPQLLQSVEYICETIIPAEIRIEAAFCRDEFRSQFRPDDAEEFCSAFLAAQAVARAHGIELSSSGSRLGEVHGRYCQIFRKVKQVVPGDVLSACFKCSDFEQAGRQKLALTDVGEYAADQERLAQLCDILSTDEMECQECFNRFHCSRGCPDVCPLQGGQDAGSFRCRVNRSLAESELLQMARLSLLEHARKYGYAGMVCS